MLKTGSTATETNSDLRRDRKVHAENGQGKEVACSPKPKTSKEAAKSWRRHSLERLCSWLDLGLRIQS